MTSPNHETPTTPGWAAPTGAPSGAPSDGQSWQPGPDTPPGAMSPPRDQPGYPAPVGYGTPLGYPTPAGYPSAPGYGPPTGYRPPAAQPGIVPLRPLGLGEILDGAFRAIRANPRVMFGLTAVVVTITVAAQTVFQWYVGGLIGSATQDATSSIDPTGELGFGETLGPAVAQLLTLPALALATTVLTGLLIVAVSRSVLGRTVTIGEVWGTYRARVGLVVLFTLGLVVATALVLGMIAGLVTLAVANGADVLAVTFGVVGGVVFLVGYFWVLVRTLLIPPAIMLEGAGLGSAIRRGWKLSRGSFWRLLGIYLLTSIIVSIVNALIVAPANLVVAFAFGDPLMTSFGSLVVLGIANVVALTLTTVFTAAVIALLYIDVRMRREGLDVELARAAAAEPAA